MRKTPYNKTLLDVFFPTLDCNPHVHSFAEDKHPSNNKNNQWHIFSSFTLSSNETGKYTRGRTDHVLSLHRISWSGLFYQWILKMEQWCPEQQNWHGLSLRHGHFERGVNSLEVAQSCSSEGEVSWLTTILQRPLFWSVSRKHPSIFHSQTWGWRGGREHESRKED